MSDTYKVYVKTDAEGCIKAVNSDAFILADDLPNWTQIDEGGGDKYHHAQGNYFTDPPLYGEQGIPNYKMVEEQAVERTAEEIQADINAIPPPPPTLKELVIALITGGCIE